MVRLCDGAVGTKGGSIRTTLERNTYMATTDVGPGRTGTVGTAARRLTTETKAAWKTTELLFYILVSVGVLIASYVMDGDNEAGGGGDPFTSDQAWLYVTILTVGYMLSRGLAKAGSRDPYWDRSDRRD